MVRLAGVLPERIRGGAVAAAFGLMALFDVFVLFRIIVPALAA
jgi:hypothetical protein